MDKDFTFNIDGFRMIAKSSQKDLLAWLEIQLPEYYGEEVIATEDYVFAKGTAPILLVSHLDTVHSKLPEYVIYDQELDIINDPNGIGGDDRCGVYSILKLITLHQDKLPSVLFTTFEETGMSGASAASEELIYEVSDIKYVVELDRKNSIDCVFYGCQNKKFHDFVETYGFETAIGSASDISRLCPTWDIAGVNLSVGSYNQHMLSEYIKPTEMMETIKKVSKMILDIDKSPKFKYTVTVKDLKKQATRKANKKYKTPAEQNQAIQDEILLQVKGVSWWQLGYQDYYTYAADMEETFGANWYNLLCPVQVRKSSYSRYMDGYEDAELADYMGRPY